MIANTLTLMPTHHQLLPQDEPVASFRWKAFKQPIDLIVKSYHIHVFHPAGRVEIGVESLVPKRIKMQNPDSGVMDRSTEDWLWIGFQLVGG